MLVFTNLYYQHDYYLAAVTPAVAALVGLGAGYVWDHIPHRPAFVVGAVVTGALLALVTLDLGRGYWLRIHGSEDDPYVLPITTQVTAHTTPADRVAFTGYSWTPTLLYYSHRWGHMVVPWTEDVAFDLIHENGYRFLVADENADLSPLERWPYVGALDRNVYALGNDATQLSQARFAVTDAGPATAFTPRPLRIRCGEPVSLRAHDTGTWLRLSAAMPSARLRVSDELGALPARRYAWIAPAAPGQDVRVTCAGAPSVTVEAIAAGGVDAP
jgi:hypothetical protein